MPILPDGMYLIQNFFTHEVLEPEAGLGTAGTLVVSDNQGNTAINTAMQTWEVRHNPVQDAYTFYNSFAKSYLAVGANLAPPRLAYPALRMNSEPGLFKVVPGPINGAYFVATLTGNTVWDQYEGSGTLGTPAIIYTKKQTAGKPPGNYNQQWSFIVYGEAPVTSDA